jgi:hypothetical protein
MILFILIIICLYAAFKILTSSILFKFLFALFGWLGMYWFFIRYIPSSIKYGIIVNNFCVTWSIIVPSAMLIVAYIFIKD